MSEKVRKCGPCCHNGHGKKEQLKPLVVRDRPWIVCGKIIAWQDVDGTWNYDLCDHSVLPNRNANMPTGTITTNDTSTRWIRV